jgi:hypothetical protein
MQALLIILKALLTPLKNGFVITTKALLIPMKEGSVNTPEERLCKYP